MERKVWDIVFKGGVANRLTAYGKLYYDSPLKPSLFTLKSLGSVGRDSKTISGVSDNQENFLINAHESENPDNIDYGCNVNSLFYEYAPNNIQTISLESAPARVILDHSNLFGENINFITSAQTRNGSTTLSDTIDVLDTTNRNLSLNIGDTVFKAFEWNNILNKSFDIRLYNDSDLDENCTNIPLALLNCFGNSLDDDDRNVNWIDIAKMKLNLMISVPEGFSDYENMVSPINYPGTTSWFGIGQQFSNKIIVEPEEIQPSTANGKSGNPRFIIPMGRFTGTNHTIEISINYSYQGTNVLTSTRGSSFIYDVEVYGGLFNFDTGKLDLLIPDESKLVRISPNEPVEYDNGYHGTTGVNVFAVMFDDELNKSEEKVYNEMLDKLKELNIYDKDLASISNDS